MPTWLVWLGVVVLVAAAIGLAFIPGVPSFATVLSLLLAVVMVLINRGTSPAWFRIAWVRLIAPWVYKIPGVRSESVKATAESLRRSPQYLPTWQRAYQRARRDCNVDLMQGLFVGGLRAFHVPAAMSSVIENHAKTFSLPRAQWRDLGNAIALCKLGIWLHSRNAALWSNLVHYLRESQQHFEALKACRKAQGLRGFTENTYLLKAELELLVLLDNYSEAVQVGQRLLRPHLLGQMTPAIQAEVHQLVGRAEWKSGHRSQAEEHLRQSLDLADDYGYIDCAAKTLLHWGRFLIAANERRAACEKFYTAMERLVQGHRHRCQVWRSLAQEFRNNECAREIGKTIPTLGAVPITTANSLAEDDPVSRLATTKPNSGCQAVPQGGGLFTIVDLRPVDASGKRNEYKDRSPDNTKGLWARAIQEYTKIASEPTISGAFEPHPTVAGVWIREAGPGKVDIYVRTEPPTAFFLVDTRQLGAWDDLIGVWQASRGQLPDDEED